MTTSDISTIQRFIGIVEGIATTLPKESQSLVYDYVEVIDLILDREGGANK